MWLNGLFTELRARFSGTGPVVNYGFIMESQNMLCVLVCCLELILAPNTCEKEGPTLGKPKKRKAEFLPDAQTVVVHVSM